MHDRLVDRGEHRDRAEPRVRDPRPVPLALQLTRGLGQREQRCVVGAQDRVVGSADLRAVAAEHLVLAPDGGQVVGAAGPLVRTEVGHVGVPRHQPQGGALAAPADQHRHPRLLHGTGPDVGARDLEMRAGMGNRPGPHPADNPGRLGQGRQPLGRRREAQAQLAELRGVVTGAQAEHQAAAADPVHVGRLPGNQRGTAVIDAAHQRDEAQPGGDGSQGRQLGPAVHAAERMVVGPVRVETEFLGADREVPDLGPLGQERSCNREARPLLSLTYPRVHVRAGRSRCRGGRRRAGAHPIRPPAVRQLAAV